MIKSKIKEISGEILKRGFNLFEGTGIGKISIVSKLFTRLASTYDLRITKEAKGYKFTVRASPQSLFYFSGRFEPSVTDLYCSLLKEGMTVADVGASTGYYTLLASKIVWGTGLVLSFEPEPHRFRELVDNILINECNNVKPFKLAISDKEGETEFELLDALGYGCVVEARKSIEKRKRIRVKTTTLDSFLHSLSIEDVDLVKIDVEGAELEVLRGMRKILSRGKVKIICEVHPDRLSSLGYSIEDVENILKEYGYKIYLISPDGLIPTDSIGDKYAHYLFTAEEMTDARRDA